MANGYPIAALGGRADVMDRFNTRVGGDVMFGGTYNGHAVGQMNYHLTDQTLPSCVAGTLQSIDFDMHGQTVTPLYG